MEGFSELRQVDTEGGAFGRLFTTFIPSQEVLAMQSGGYLNRGLRRDPYSGALRPIGLLYSVGARKYLSEPGDAGATNPFRLAPPFLEDLPLNMGCFISFSFQSKRESKIFIFHSILSLPI